MASYINFVFMVDTRPHKLEVPPEIKKGDKIIVHLDNANELAEVVSIASDNKDIDDRFSFVRIATDQDKKQQTEKIKNSIQIKSKVQNVIEKHNLKLKLIKVHMSFDGSKLLVVYTAPERVDFRELVKELAGFFHTHVEMHQVNERESACILGGFAECGQELCCRRFLRDPKLPSIKMAKTQDMALSPNKINGVCGKLRCCLAFEYGDYKQVLDKMPVLNSRVDTPKGSGKVVYLDLMREQIRVQFGEDDVQSFSLNEIKIA